MIQSVFAPLARNAGAFGLMDDAALLAPRPGEEIVLTSDMLVEDRHFLADTSPADIAWKSLAVNISDLVAKGADPDSYLLSIALTAGCGREWLEAFSGGLSEAQDAFGCHLAGGDTVATSGALTISITTLGRVPAGRMVHRSGAKAGDLVYVTGAIGDAVAGLELLRKGESGDGDSDVARLVSRHRRPVPEPKLAPVIRNHANAAMDISDGLAGDLEKLCAASQCGATIRADDVPVSGPALAMIERGIVALETLITGGDDYCVLAAVAPEGRNAFEQAAASAGPRAVRIGMIETQTGVRIIGKDGNPMRLSRAGFDHFAE